MQADDPRARIAYQGSAISRAKQVAFKVVVVLGAAVALASAFVLSLAFLTIGLAVVLVFGGYLWWKTRDLRKQFRERMHSQRQAPSGQIIEGEVISRDERIGDRPRSSRRG